MGYTEVEVYAIINLISHDLISHSAFSPNEAAENDRVYISDAGAFCETKDCQIILAIVMRELDERRAESDPDPPVVVFVAASGLRYVDSFVLVGSWTSSRSCGAGAGGGG